MDLQTLRELLIFFGCRLHDWCAPKIWRQAALSSCPSLDACRHTQAVAVRGALALCRAPPAADVQLPAEDSQTLVASLAEHVHLQDLKEHEQQDCLDLLSSLEQVPAVSLDHLLVHSCF